MKTKPTDSHSSNHQPAASGEDVRPRAWDDFDLESHPGFLRRHPVFTAGLSLAAIGSLAWFWNDLFPAKKSTGPRRETVVAINVPPPPPPPPPPPVATPPPPPMEEKMVDQAPVENEPKPDPTPDEPPAANLATGIKGDGPPDGFGLSGTGGTRTGGNGTGSTAARSRWGWYAGQVQTRIQQAVQTNRRTRNASLRADVKIWADATGRVTRASVANTSADPALDAVLRDEILTGLQLSQPPPEGMPMPIVMRVTIRRP